MALPPKTLCLPYLKAAEASAAISKAVRDAKAVIAKIIKTKSSIKFGLSNLADVIGAELLSAIDAVAASVAQTALGALSKASAAVLELVFSELLKILLGAPTAIFSLVAIPQTQAREACNKERLYLDKAKKNFDTILEIIVRWTSGMDHGKYYEQMVRAMPYINNSIQLISDMIIELTGNPTNDNQSVNAVFDQSKYRLLQINLHSAIRETKPYSVINNSLGITSIIENNTSRIYRELEKKINNEYKNSRLKANREYLEKINKLASENTTIDNVVKVETAKNEYSTKLNIISATHKAKLAKAQVDAKVQATFNARNYLEAISGIGASFVFDMQQITDNLDQLSKNILQAYASYKLSQMMCNSIYNIRSLIQNVINELIALITKSGNLAGSAVIKSLEISQAMVELTQEKFSSVINKVESSEHVTAMQLSQTVFVGNQLLTVADSNLDATITESLIKLINSDDVLSDASGRFDKFITDIENIPDWDGKTGVWAVDILNSSQAPYIKFISDIGEILTSIPALAISDRNQDQKIILDLMKKIDLTFRMLRTHNFMVSGVLYSYTPYMDSEFGNLTRLLANAGLLQGFAVTMSVIQIIAKLSMDLVSNFDDYFPLYDKCQQYKNDPQFSAFNDPEIAFIAEKKERDIAPSQYHKSVQESNENAHDDVMRLKRQVSSFTINPKPQDHYGWNAK